LVGDIEYVETNRHLGELDSTYFNFLEALFCAKQHGIKSAVVHSPSRIVDEINGIIHPSNPTFLETYIRRVSPYFIDLSFKKQSEEDFNRLLEKEGKVLIRSHKDHLSTPEKMQKDFVQKQKKDRINRVKKLQEVYQRKE
jgi:hypothetical protein